MKTFKKKTFKKKRRKVSPSPRSSPSPLPISYMRFTGLAVEWTLLIAIGTYGGYWLDGYIGTYEPLFLVIGMLLGMGCAGMRLYAKVLKS